MYKIDKLLKLDQKLFHTADLALIWEIKNKNTLYTTIKRYVQKGILLAIQKGFYSTVPFEHIDPLRLALGFIHRYSYLSCETILIQQGLIFQKENAITFVSDVSKKFEINKQRFVVRKMRNQFLYNNLGVENKNGILVAGLNRAVADMLYFNPRFHFDNQKNIEWKKVKSLQKQIGFL